MSGSSAKAIRLACRLGGHGSKREYRAIKRGFTRDTARARSKVRADMQRIRHAALAARES